MAQLNDIKGYWDETYSYSFNDNNMWYGQILLEEDNWFEGMVVTPSSLGKEVKFIFGVYYPEKVIELYKISKTNAPLVYHGKRDAKGYDGDFETMTVFGNIKHGAAHIITQETGIYEKLEREAIAEQEDSLRKSIEDYKKDSMNESEKELYEEMYATRNSLCQTVLRKNKGIVLVKKMAESQNKDNDS